ncbi:transposase domain containing protein [Trichonephila clavipes]|nr:transposase domain containing protein [Trichonephila clavipes]
MALSDSLPQINLGVHGVTMVGSNGIFQQDNAPCHKAKIVLEWFQEHDAEFQLMSPDLNQIEHLWDVMVEQLRVQRPPIHNISDLRDRSWHNLSPAMYPGLVASTPRRVVLRA